LERLLQQAQEQQRAAYEQKLSEQITKFAEGKNYGRRSRTNCAQELAVLLGVPVLLAAELSAFGLIGLTL
jgi:hypothetical protein